MAEVKIDQAGIRQLREAIAHGLANYGYVLESRAKDNAPVRGHHRSFAPGGPTGGTLRRSIHSAVYLDGRKVSGPGADQNGRPLPDHPTDGGIVLVVGTNSGYGLFVETGTVRMAARPYLSSALMETRDQAPASIEAGIRQKARG
jgi:hypothetical protein